MTTENNKIIAEFMDFKLQDNPNERFFNQWLINTPTEIAWSNREKILFFECDWNWLLKVVEKIETVLYGEITFEIEGANVKIHNLDRSFHKYVTMETKIESVYNACVEFIKWYNKNRKEN